MKKLKKFSEIHESDKEFESKSEWSLSIEKNFESTAIKIKKFIVC